MLTVLVPAKWVGAEHLKANGFPCLSTSLVLFFADVLRMPQVFAVFRQLRSETRRRVISAWHTMNDRMHSFVHLLVVLLKQPKVGLADVLEDALLLVRAQTYGLTGLS